MPKLGRDTLLFLGPVVLMGLSWGLAQLLPFTDPWSVALGSALLMTPRWCWFLYTWWGIRSTLLRKKVGFPLVIGLIAALLAGLPLPAEGGGLRVATANVNYFAQGELADLTRDLQALRADVLLVLEGRTEQIPGMVLVGDNRGPDLPQKSRAAQVYCREGVQCRTEITPLQGKGRCTMPITLTLVEATFCFVGVHSPPPVPYCVEGQMPYLEGVADHLQDGKLRVTWGPCGGGLPVVLAGDLNAVPGSPPFEVISRAGLRDFMPRWMGIWSATWPNGGGWPKAPFFRIDHILAGGGLSLDGLQVHTIADSDHRAVVASVILPGSQGESSRSVTR